MIIRSEIESGRYTALPNSMVRDRRLSFAARGVMGYIIMKGGRVTLDELRERTPKGSDDDILEIIRELSGYGYVNISEGVGDDNTKR